MHNLQRKIFTDTWVTPGWYEYIQIVEHPVTAKLRDTNKMEK